MSCPIETERRAPCSAENAATASCIKNRKKGGGWEGGGGVDGKLLVRTEKKNVTMSFLYKCINSPVDEADYIHFLHAFFFLFLSRAVAHAIMIHNPRAPLPPTFPKCCKCSKRELTSNLKKKKKEEVFFSLIQRSLLSCEILHWFKRSRRVVGLLQLNGSTLMRLGFIASKKR